MKKVSLFAAPNHSPPPPGMGAAPHRVEHSRTQKKENGSRVENDRLDLARRIDRPGRSPDPTARLRIATRIHFALLRHDGEDLAVSALLADEGDAREALWVCEASGHDDLTQLAKAFRAAPQAMPIVAPRGMVAQELAWSRDTSGFGVSRLPGLSGAAEPADTPATEPAPRRTGLSRWWRTAVR